MFAATRIVQQASGQSCADMKKIVGINPDFADFDELDADALDAVEEFQQGFLTFEELKTLVGPEAAQAIKEQRYGPDDIGALFDDPEDY